MLVSWWLARGPVENIEMSVSPSPHSSGHRLELRPTTHHGLGWRCCARHSDGGADMDDMLCRRPEVIDKGFVRELDCKEGRKTDTR
jgi:hypothetical protein